MQIKLSHLAIASSELEKLSEKFAKLSLKIQERHAVPSEKVQVGMIPVSVSDAFRIELLEPSSPDSSIAGFLQKKPAGGLHHVCFEVKKIEAWLALLEKEGFEVLPPGIRNGARGKVLFIHPKSLGGVLVELEEIG